jgi:diadenylate cyclase
MLAAFAEHVALFLQSRETWWIDVIDVLVVTFVVYQLLKLIRGTHAVQVAVGGVMLVLLFWISQWLDLQALNWLIRTFLPYAVFGILVIFQPEIRKILAHVGKTPLGGLFGAQRTEELLDEIVLATTSLAARKIGAILVLEREMGLKSYIETGIALDAQITYDLLINVFAPGTPLHDGALIVQGKRVAAAACFLPLTVNPELSRTLGSRHRAAIGVTEDTDAVAVVVSEETGTISIVVEGRIRRGLDGAGLRQALYESMEMERSRAARHDAAGGRAAAGPAKE